MRQKSSRRRFIGSAVAAAASASVQPAGRVRGFDHVALPMQNSDAMLAFYRGLGFEVAENPNLCSVYIGDNMINFHRPALWQRESFTLRAPAAKPPCGDLCFVWDGTPQALKALLDRAGAKVIEGPAPRQGGRRKPGSSTLYSRPRRQPARIHHLFLTAVAHALRAVAHAPVPACPVGTRADACV